MNRENIHKSRHLVVLDGAKTIDLNRAHGFGFPGGSDGKESA